MDRFLIARLDIAPEHRDAFESWLRHEHLPSTSSVAGLDGTAVCYRAVRLETVVRTYLPTPEFTTIFGIDPHIEVADLVDSQAFLDWWAGAIRSRFRWVTSHNWVVCEREAGRGAAIAHDRVLLTQVHVAPGHEDDWGEWYDSRHIAMARNVPELFEHEQMRFRAIDVAGRDWHCSARPLFTHLLPIRPGADIVAGAATPEFLEQVTDTQALWAGAIEHAVSTICERFV